MKERNKENFMRIGMEVQSSGKIQKKENFALGDDKT